ncbi:MAG: glycosyltransferase family 39 protein [Candidatus Binatia bacterium]|nr:glycosyltransferase family 39 protein [Candidatus Binatia bacterium]
MNSSGRLAAPFFWTVATLLLLVGLGSPSLRGSEDRFAEITREMILSGDYFHPTLNGEPHFHKPLASYWAIAGASRVLGTLDELAARLPSVLAGLLALWATVRLGRELWNPIVGRTAGWVLLGSYGFLLWSRTAAADMENLAAVILAVTWFRCREDRLTMAFYLVFVLICVVGAHAKGLAAIVLPALVLFPHLARHGQWRAHLSPSVLVAAAVAVIVYFAPFIAADIARPDLDSVDALVSGDTRSGLYMVFQENVRRFYAPHDHQGPITTYLFALPVLLLPWALVWIAALLDCAREWVRLEPETRWVLISIGLIFAVFTAAGSRRSYYILPIVPFCALLVAAVLDGEARGRFVERALRWTAIALAAVMGAELAVALLAPVLGSVYGVSVPPALVMVTLMLAAFARLIWVRADTIASCRALKLGLPPGVVCPTALSVVVLGGYFALQAPLLDRFRTERPFALALRGASADLDAGRVAFVRHAPSLFPFYLDAPEPLPVLGVVSDVTRFAAGGRGLIVASPRSLSRLGGETPRVFERPPDLQEGLYPWDQKDERLAAWWVGGEVSPKGPGD